MVRRGLWSVLACVLVWECVLMADVTLDYALQGSTVTRLVVPANSTEINVDVPFDPTEWLAGHNRQLTISLQEVDGDSLGSSDNVVPAFERGTGRARFQLRITMNIYRDDLVPEGISTGRAYFIGNAKYRQQTIRPNVDVIIVSKQNGVEAMATYGMTATVVK